MEDIELQRIWQSYDKKLAEAKILNLQSWTLHLRCFESLQKGKATSKLQSLLNFKIWAILLGIFWIAFLGILIFGNRFENPFFSFSVLIILLFTVYMTAIYIKHIILIKKINYSENIKDTQTKLIELQLSTIQSTRIAWLQLPFYSTWFWNSHWFSMGLKFWLVPFPITISLTLLAVYLYKKIRVENLHISWVRTLMMSGPEYKSVLKAQSFIQEIEILKQELA